MLMIPNPSFFSMRSFGVCSRGFPFLSLNETKVQENQFLSDWKASTHHLV
jgi:hypothetical protein